MFTGSVVDLLLFCLSFRGCTWFASIHSTPGTPMETTCICATTKTCACCPGSKSSSGYLPLSHKYYPTRWSDLKLHLPSFPQQIWSVHKDHRSAWRQQAEAVLSVSDRQVLSWSTQVVKQTTQKSRATICYFIITLKMDLVPPVHTYYLSLPIFLSGFKLLRI